jgi:hypothetical protein
MAALLREVIAGAQPEQLGTRASAILREIDCRSPCEPAEDDKDARHDRT